MTGAAGYCSRGTRMHFPTGGQGLDVGLQGAVDPGGEDLDDTVLTRHAFAALNLP